MCCWCQYKSHPHFHIRHRFHRNRWFVFNSVHSQAHNDVSTLQFIMIWHSELTPRCLHAFSSNKESQPAPGHSKAPLQGESLMHFTYSNGLLLQTMPILFVWISLTWNLLEEYWMCALAHRWLWNWMERKLKMWDPWRCEFGMNIIMFLALCW